MISTSEVVDEIERQIIGQRQGKVWCAPNAVVLPGDAGTLQYDAIWKVALPREGEWLNGLNQRKYTIVEIDYSTI